MVGYSLNTWGYHIWILSEQKSTETINVTFNDRGDSLVKLKIQSQNVELKAVSKHILWNSDTESSDSESNTEFSEYNGEHEINLMQIWIVRKQFLQPNRTKTDIYYQKIVAKN